MKMFLFFLLTISMVGFYDLYGQEIANPWDIHEFNLIDENVIHNNVIDNSNESRESKTFYGTLPVYEKNEKSIIGTYRREKILNTTRFPYRTMGLILFKDLYGINYSCTGTLVGPRHVLTAGHCIFEYDNDQDLPIGWYRDVTFIPGRNGKVSPYGKIKGKKLLSVTGYTKHGKNKYDYGLIVLEEDIGNELGWLSYGYKKNIIGDWMNVVGYPGDEKPGTLWKSYCPIEDEGTTNLVLHYKCDTSVGQSGGPMFRKVGSERIIHGVITAEYLNWEMNIGRKISSTAYSTIKKWISKN